MSSLVILVFDNMIEKITSLRFVKTGLYFWFITAVLSQIAVFYLILPGFLDPSIPLTEIFRNIFDFREKSFMEIWRTLVSTAGLILLKIDIFIYVIALVFTLTGVWGIKNIPAKWIEDAGIVFLTILFIAPIIVLGLLFAELFPFYIGNIKYFINRM
jgi:hypothetical protein